MKKVILFFAALAAITSCSKEGYTADSSADANLETITIRANAPQTRTQLVNGTDVQWSPNDVVKVCFEAYSGMSSVSGASANLASLSSEVSESALFSGQIGSLGDVVDNGFVVYPSSVSFNSKTNYYGTLTNDHSYDLKSVQEAVDNTFASGLNFSWAPVTKKQIKNNNPSVTFRNMCALIKITLPSEDKDVRSINIKSSNTDLTGNRSFIWSASSTSQALTLDNFKSSSDEVTLARKDGSALTPGASYYAVVWPGAAPHLTLTFVDSQDRTCVKSVNAQNALVAGNGLELNVKSLDMQEFTPVLNLSTESISVGNGSGTTSFTLSTNEDWTVSSDQNWLSFSPASGLPAEDATVTVTVQASNVYEPRTATITVATTSGLNRYITVTQDAAIRKYRIVSPVTNAADLDEGKLYVIFFANGASLDSYCWKVNSSNTIEKAYASSSANGTEFTSEYVFMYDYYAEVNSSELTNSNNGYGSKEVGKLKSVHANGYLTSSFFVTGQSDAYGMAMMFGNHWTGEGDTRRDIDIWYRKGNGLGSYKYEQTIYWNGSSLALGTTANTPRKWFFFEVE